MEIMREIPLVDEVLGGQKTQIGDDYDGYRNHVYRMLNFCFALQHPDEVTWRKLEVAGAFHDIGMWTAGTFDYLSPSLAAAETYLMANGLEDWCPEIELMIDEHHKLRRFRPSLSPLVEVFREGDLVDLSMGVVKFGLPKDFVKDVKAGFPNAGFHKAFVGRELSWAVRHPLRPLPVAKW